ncbi:MAG: tRNA pseudouridine(55) synthase TruB [Nitriliruptoraceae bacterium]
MHDGVLVVDKPAGMTSHDVVDVVRRAVGHQRVGHTGTLDPAATGVLVLCLGRATKLVRFLQSGRKTYAAEVRLGVTTTSQDADGEVVATTDASHLDERTVCEALMRFQGTYPQLPPMVSAVKVGGQRLHEAARRGEDVEREPREITVDSIVLDGYEPGEQPRLSFLVTCSPGTYVRTLAHDLGELLGVGGSLAGLRRLANGPFVIDEAVELGAVTAAGERGEAHQLLLDPADAVRRALPSVEVTDPALLRRLTEGARLDAQGAPGPFAVFAPVSDGEQLIGVYTDQEGGQAAAELVWTRPQELA